MMIYRGVCGERDGTPGKHGGRLWRSRPGWLVFLWLLALLFARPGPGLAQGGNGITTPAPGDVVAGVVIVQGTAAHSSFLRYELAFNNGREWIVFAEGDRPVVNGTLAIWDTTVGGPAAPVFPDGTYQLRLRVVRQDYNYDEYVVNNIVVANAGAVPTATPTVTATGTPAGDAAGTPPAVATTGSEDLAPPAVLPSLTPFPTPSPQATPENVVVEGGSRPGQASDESEQGGLLDQLRAIDTGRFGRAFWQGATLTFYLFLVLGLYLLLRGLWRWAWRLVRVWLARRPTKHDDELVS